MKGTVLAALLFTGTASAQSIEYAWLNLPCASMLNCDTGCSACNSARNTAAWFTGTEVGWIGVDVCPHPILTGDNSLSTYGWPAIADEDHLMVLSGIAFSPIHVDSLVFRHSASVDGPQRVRVRFGVNEALSTHEVADLPVPADPGNAVITELGDVQPEGGMLYGFFSLVLQPYLGSGGAWELDDLRIVGSPASIAMFTPDLSVPAGATRSPKYDALGRPIIERPGLRFYLDGSKHVVLGR